MPAFGFRCKCCGLMVQQQDPAADSKCGVCEAPVLQHADVVEPLLYGEPLAIVVQALLCVMRDQTARGQDLVSVWRESGAAALDASHFEALAQVTGFVVDGAQPTALHAANTAAAAWLLDASNAHVPASFSALYERYFVETCFDDPEALSYLGLLENTGLRAHNRELADRPSKAASKRAVAHAKRDLELLGAMEAAAGGAAPLDESVSVGVLRWQLEATVSGAPFAHHAYAIEQMDGAHVVLQMWMTDITPVRCSEDGWNYVARLRAFPARLGRVEEEMRTQAALGIVPPRFVVDKVLGAVGKMAVELTASPAASALYTSLQERMGELPDLDGGDDGDDDGGDDGAPAKPAALPSFIESSFKTKVAYDAWVKAGGPGKAPPELMAAAEAAIVECVGPAYASLQHALEELLAPMKAAGHVMHAGYGALPDGAAYYAWRLRGETSTRMSPEEVHQLGHEQVAAILGEMKAVILKLHAAGDAVFDPAASVADNMRALSDCEKWLYPDTDAGREECLEDFRELVRKIDAKLDSYFDLRPKQPLKIQRVPPHMEEGSPAAFYMPPSLDGSRDGVFYANLGDMSAQYKYGMRTLTAHEAVPGHHFQLAIQFEMRELPYFRKAAEGFNAFVEGWALYTEKLAREFGFFATEPDGSEGYDVPPLEHSNRGCRINGGGTREPSPSSILLVCGIQ
eukprot:2337713-Prymnesium_polylepis.3